MPYIHKKSCHGKRKRRRPKINYTDYFAKLINYDVPPTVEEIRKLDSDKIETRGMVQDCCPRQHALLFFKQKIKLHTLMDKTRFGLKDWQNFSFNFKIINFVNILLFLKKLKIIICSVLDFVS